MHVRDLTGLALDWAVCKCEGEQPSRRTRYSTDWSVGGPIIEHEGIAMWQDEETLGWFASADEGRGNDYLGPTPLIAAMRCYVASKLGDEVEVPSGLEP